MKVIFTDIRWRSEEDSDIFNMHAIESIELDMQHNIITIKCAVNTFSAPFDQLTYGGGITHWELLTKHPYKTNEYIYIAIFENLGKVAISTAHYAKIAPWFEYKCKTYVHV